MTVVTALKHATTTSVFFQADGGMGGLIVTGVQTGAVPISLSATAPSGPVSFSQDTDSTAFASCTLGSPTTNTTTGAVSTSCSVSYTPATVGAHLITASYGSDINPSRAHGSAAVSILKSDTTTT